MHRTFANIMVTSAGFACFLALNSFSLWGFTLLPQTAIGEHARLLWSVPLSTGNALAFPVLFIGFLRFPRLAARALWPLACMLIAVAIVSIGVRPVQEGDVVLRIAGTCMGVGTTCCFFCWARAFFADGIELACIEIVLGSVLSAVPYLAFFTLDSSAIIVTLGVLAFVNLGFLLVHDRLLCQRDDTVPSERSLSIRRLVILFWRPLLCLALIGCSGQIIAMLLCDAVAGLSFVEQSLMIHSENIAAAAILAVIWFGVRRSFGIVEAFGAVFPIFATVLLFCLLVETEQRVFALYITGIVFVVFSMLTMTESFSSVARDTGGPIVAYGLFAGVFYCANRISYLIVGRMDEALLAQESTISIVLFALMYGSAIVLFLVTRNSRYRADAIPIEQSGLELTDGETVGVIRRSDKGFSDVRGAETRSRFVFDDSSDESESGERAVTEAAVRTTDFLDESCMRLSREHELSERQSEVLALLARGYDTPAISRKLYVSQNTVRTHVKKLYVTLGVHSKQDLIELVNKAR